ncbi:MAG: ATP-dependent DNA helicase RecG [Clostridia bacterium]|nr:ATP-dependent DNA helicase RecG [Clostridia bacterium]
MIDVLNSPVTVLRGIGQKRAELLKKLNIITCADLIRFFPRGYLNMSEICPIDKLVDGQTVTVVAKVSSDISKRVGKRVTRFLFSVSDPKGNTLFVTLYNQKYTAEHLHPGMTVLLHGTVSVEGLVRRMESPRIKLDATPEIEPIYPLTEGVTQASLARNIATALQACNAQLKEMLLPSIREKCGLPEIHEAFRAVHFPRTIEEAEKAKNRFIFEELFLFTVGVRILKLRVKKLDAPQLVPTDLTPFLNRLPYALTNAQKRVIKECFDGIRRSSPMSRLIQGDVGSGKTVIAAAVTFLTARNGKQTALMVPTEILAIQHYESLSALLSPCGVRVELLTGSMRAAEKRDLLLRLEAGQVDLVIGTHALIQKSVKFKELAVAIADEQHRFGVQQRAAMQEKGKNPHMIFLSATPIPRSLALVLYGDLDISILDELPPGRIPVATRRVGSEMEERMYRYVREKALNGEQSYVVCPSVEGGDEMKNAVDFSEQLRKTYLQGISVACLHGRMKSEEKEAILSDFAKNKISVLVSTTVIEVGVNVPNATTMIIENAERFGLSQLHQLRGRVGRGKKESYCFVVSDDKSEEATERLNALCTTNDGFEISKKDLELRGPGDFLGNRQHGLPPFKIADLTRDMKILEQVSKVADRLFKDPSWFILPENRALFISASEMLRSAMLQ